MWNMFFLCNRSYINGVWDWDLFERKSRSTARIKSLFAHLLVTNGMLLFLSIRNIDVFIFMMFFTTSKSEHTKSETYFFFSKFCLKNIFKSTRTESICAGNSVKSNQKCVLNWRDYKVSLFHKCSDAFLMIFPICNIQESLLKSHSSLAWANADIKCSVIRTRLISQQKLSFSKPHQVARVEDIQMSSVTSNWDFCRDR